MRPGFAVTFWAANGASIWEPEAGLWHLLNGGQGWLAIKSDFIHLPIFSRKAASVRLAWKFPSALQRMLIKKNIYSFTCTAFAETNIDYRKVKFCGGLVSLTEQKSSSAWSWGICGAQILWFLCCGRLMLLSTKLSSLEVLEFKRYHFSQYVWASCPRY